MILVPATLTTCSPPEEHVPVLRRRYFERARVTRVVRPRPGRAAIRLAALPKVERLQLLIRLQKERNMAIQGKVAVVTGGGRGIGQGVARSLLEAGATVVIAARSDGPLADTVDQLSPLGPISKYVCDVSEPESVRALFEHVDGLGGGVDILVCSHGVLNAGIPLLDYPVDLWDETIAINLKGTFLASQAAARVMVRNECHGRIIVISSIVAIASAPNETAYDASKGGVEALTRAMALDLAPYAITVNSVAPGWIRTPMVESIMTPEVERTCNPLRRFGEPEHVGNAVVFLADPASSQVTAATIFVDGGQRAALAGNPLNA